MWIICGSYGSLGIYGKIEYCGEIGDKKFIVVFVYLVFFVN